MALAGVHFLAKRGITVPHVIIIVAVLGSIIVLNIVLLAAWCATRRRRTRARKNRSELVIGSDNALEPEKTTKASRRRTSSSSSPSQAPSYMQMIMSLQTTVTPYPDVSVSPAYIPPPVQHVSLRKPPSVYRPEETPHSSSSNISDHLLIPGERFEMCRISRGTSLRRSNSMSSLSMYSSASAPTDLQERIFQPMALGPAPSSAPAWASHGVRSQQSQATAQQASTIRNELAPETYTAKAQPQWRVPQPSQLQWTPQPMRHRARPLSESSYAIPPVPPLPEHIHNPPITRPQPAALRIIPEFTPSEIGYTLKEGSESLLSVDSPLFPPGLSPPFIQVIPLDVRKGIGRAYGDDTTTLPLTPNTPLTPSGPPPELPARSPFRPSVA